MTIYRVHLIKTPIMAAMAEIEASSAEEAGRLAIERDNDETLEWEMSADDIAEVDTIEECPEHKEVSS